jgi:hypothetical protein
MISTPSHEMAPWVVDDRMIATGRTPHATSMQPMTDPVAGRRGKFAHHQQGCQRIDEETSRQARAAARFTPRPITATASAAIMPRPDSMKA